MSTSFLAKIYELMSLCYSDRPPNWSALSDAFVAATRSVSVWLASIFLHLASRLGDSDRSSLLLLRGVDERSGQCLAPDHRPTDLVPAGILERPVALQDPVYWLPEGPLPHGLATTRQLEDPIMPGAGDISSLLWFAVVARTLVFIAIIVVWLSTHPPRDNIRLLRCAEHEFILEEIVVRLDLQATGQPVPPPEDQVEPVAPEAEAGPPVPAQEHPEGQE